MNSKRYKDEEYRKIEGEFIITKEGKFFIDNKELKNDDVVHLKIKILKEIIADARGGVI